MYKTLIIGLFTMAGIFAAQPVLAENLQQSISAFDAIDCKPVVEQELKNYKIQSSNIKHIDYYNTSSDGHEDGEGNKTFQASISLNSCTGRLYISLDSGCYVERIFSTGNCVNSGLPYK